GGRLAAAAAPARVVTLVISDVPDNDPALVASGPTVPSQTTPAAALAILESYGIAIPQRVRALLDERILAATTPGAALPATNWVSVIATAADALSAAYRFAESAVVSVRMLGDALEGEARALGREHGRLALALQAAGLSHPLL